ncbi:rhomboid family intramembrane serine protease [Tumebacillus lipolyticus]|uniref:Rhomboid family intramembrane serine protease n=1 Tax=Tumebacillus lipolyticus TaxID=1280370 RepID=A0ABW4ZTH4_9BACL
MESSEQAVQRQTTLLYQLAEQLIEHDDFSILPQVSQAGQETLSQEEVQPIVLVRRRWNTAQVVRLLPVDRIGTDQIEKMLMQEALYLRQAKQQNGVRKMYSLTLFVFSHWRSDENMNAIALAGVYAGMTKSTGAVAVGVDLMRGVVGPMPWGPAVENIQLEHLTPLIKKFSEEEPSDQMITRSAEAWQQLLLARSLEKRVQVTESLKGNRKTPTVFSIIGLTVLIWMIGLQYTEQVLGFGLLIPELVRMGEWWRLLTSVFLHYEITHIMFNMVTLYFFGSIAERIFGVSRFLVIYVLAGIAGSLLSVAFAGNSSLGASGAVFGLFGALLAFGQFNRKAFSMTIGTSVYALLAINLIFGFIMPNVNNWAHIGGLIGGFLIAMTVGIPDTPNRKRLQYGLLYLAYTAITIWIGLEAPFR